MKLRTLLIACVIGLFANSVFADKKPLKVFILVGQSNMQGHAQVRTLAHIGMDKKTAPILREIQDDDGTPRVHKEVWISYLSHGDVKQGQLTTGFGADDNKIGPELTFGIYMQKQLNEPILIIKTAWGGKSINTDFRPPSAGPYKFNENQIEQFKKQKKDLKEIKAKKAEATGHYYRLMMDHVKKVLADTKSVYPKYDPKQGHELAGFVWFQGWNDMVDRGTYPTRDKPGGYDKYSEVMAHFIRDVRKDLGAPKMPFVIGVIGVGGPTSKYSPSQMRYKAVHQNIRDAMAAPASMAEFKGNVAAVRTENYWDPQLKELGEKWEQVRAKSRSLSKDKTLTREQRKTALDTFTAATMSEKDLAIYKAGTSNAGYHYLGSAKIMAGIGKGFAEALANISKKR